jgi:hypothetical protein
MVSWPFKPTVVVIADGQSKALKHPLELFITA